MQPTPAQHDKPTERVSPFLGLLLLFAFLAFWRHHIGSALPFAVDEAYYVAWSKSIDWGYWTKPPFIAWGIGAARWLCGETQGCIRATSLLTFPLTSLALLMLCRQMGWSLRAACVAAALFATLPLSSFYGIVATTDSFLLMFWAFAMLSLWLAIEGKYWAWPVLGLFFGLGMLSKYSMLVFGLSALFVLLHPRWRHLWSTSGPYVALLVALLVFFPNVAWNINHAMPTFQHTADISQGGSNYSLKWEVLVKFLLEQILIGNPLLMVGLVFSIKQWIQQPNHKSWFTLSIGLPILGVICIQALLSRAHANWAAPAYLGICIASVGYLWPHYKKTVFFALVFNGLFAATLYHYETLVAKPFQLRASALADPFWAVRSWPVLAAQVENTLTSKLEKSNWQIASDDRAVLSQVQAVLHLPAGAAHGWQHTGRPENHFDQHFPLSNEPQLPVLLITKAEDKKVTQAFPHAVRENGLQITTPTSEALTYHFWWLGLPRSK